MTNLTSSYRVTSHASPDPNCIRIRATGSSRENAARSGSNPTPAMFGGT
ncbi:hypothetical protein AB0L88_06160 [Saccharopolyspora shandongensis]